MSAKTRYSLPPRLHTLATLAALLERLEQGPGSASAGQYRDVARRISVLLAQAEPDEHLDRLLSAAPHTAEIYENLRYELAGLCRAPLTAALDAEIAAATALQRARRPR